MSMELATETVPAKKASVRSEERRRKHGRSRVANGNELLPGLNDSRSVWVRRARDVTAEFLSDFPEPTAGERLIIRRIATLVVVVEQFETEFANAGIVEGNSIGCRLDLYQRAVGNLRRLLESIGIKGRRQIDVTPTLADIAAEIHAAEAAKREGETA